MRRAALTGGTIALYLNRDDTEDSAATERRREGRWGHRTLLMTMLMTSPRDDEEVDGRFIGRRQ